MEFFLGEKKEVRINITGGNGEPFTIRNATYELMKHARVEDSGGCDVDGTMISTLIQPQETGYYSLFFTYEIANEILKANVRIEVR